MFPPQGGSRSALCFRAGRWFATPPRRFHIAVARGDAQDADPGRVAIGDAVEAAYRRGDLFDKRRKLMDAWAAYCATPRSAKVIALRQS